MAISRVSPPRGSVLPRAMMTTPGRLRVLALLALVAVIATFAPGTFAFNKAGNGLQVMGHGAGPEVVATANLYFALSDMDAQVASVLLMGNDHFLGIGWEEAQRRFEQRRVQVNQAIVQATDLAGGDTVARKTIQSILDGVGEYQSLAAKAMFLSSQAQNEPGKTPKGVVNLYRQAYEVMNSKLLPKAYNLTLDNGSIVRKTYQNTHSWVTSQRLWMGVAGLVLIVILLVLQIYMSVHFRRFINPALALATVLTFVAAFAGVLLLTNSNADLRTAKNRGFDAVLSLSRARAISNSMQADQSRYLLDSEHADTYEQTYLEKSETVFYKEAANLDIYRNAVELSVEAYKEGKIEKGAPAFLGLFGDEAALTRDATEKAALVKAVVAYHNFQQADSNMRALQTAEKTKEAIDYRMIASDRAFNAYDRAIFELIDLHKKQFDDAIRSGESNVAGWKFFLPIGAFLIAALILMGLQPRLAEYR